MKVLHCNIYENEGGASIAAKRLHTALNASGLCTSMLGVRNNISHNSQSIRLTNPLDVFLTRLSNLPLRMLKRKTQNFFSYYLLPNSVANHIQALKPDIIHLHWIANFISPWTLKQIAKLNIPVVWTLHDTWAFTGGCHYYGTCNKWKEQCTHCPDFGNVFGLDLLALQWQSKKECYAQLQPTIIGLSNHFTKTVKQSALLQKYPCVQLPNTIDSNIFKPLTKSEARKALGIAQDGFYILFGAISANSDPRKGYDLLKETLYYLADSHKNQARCLIFGASEGEELPLPSIFLGRLDKEATLALAYAAADVFVCPSREESFSQTTLEALACGTPVAGFDIGGIPDMVTHTENGYIAPPYNTKDLAKGIAYILEDEARRQSMSQMARQRVEERYAYPVIAQQYIQLYENILAKYKK